MQQRCGTQVQWTAWHWRLLLLLFSLLCLSTHMRCDVCVCVSSVSASSLSRTVFPGKIIRVAFLVFFRYEIHLINYERDGERNGKWMSVYEKGLSNELERCKNEKKLFAHQFLGCFTNPVALLPCTLVRFYTNLYIYVYIENQFL